ncbi:molybdate ABC transporter substrate-binding protein [Reichenbachiella carrageenanivorans]|uniref:Molybdate ABC transporter substrate-binding protein n=1 Tax=Reichenbachiella carrageenanivorans TaxID=2979869 RepID=A0ABY6D732_9BACT|nr:molybdate ABC transporter substrate-binding protein [Reichenbachiella carrageenanivorans]UXX80863.1 molybdate ABC transporter substrate-binding protein [Reichenbachiella carrageenanivorans]
MNRLLILLILVLASACQSSKGSKVTVAVAANMQYATQALVEQFERKYDIAVEVSSSSSGVLTTQIRQGAPFDIFMSANIKYPNTLYEEGLATSPPSTYASGTLILWTMNPEIDLKKGISALLGEPTQKIALANPETAPYGIAALEVLRHTQIYEVIAPKLVIGESIAQVNQYVLSQTVDAGLTSKSVLFSPFVKNQGYYIEIPKSYYGSIDQGIVMLQHGKEKNPENAKQFYQFMFSEEAQTILSNYGYKIN